MSELWVFVESFERAERIVLSGDEGRHVAARRLRPGDPLVAFDGAGHTGLARIESADRRGVAIRVETLEEVTPPADVWRLATAIPKGERLAILLPMLTQLAVPVWQPLVLEDSAVRSLDVESARMRRILVESAKLARRPWLLEVRPPCDLATLLGAVGRAERVCFGDRAGERTGVPSDAATVVIGPEAGFSAAELAALRQVGATAVTLGPHNMRIETAAVAAAATRLASSLRD
ncbi:MAG: RsmE family RNA methyltransferase [Myxococcota bacterium]